MGKVWKRRGMKIAAGALGAILAIGVLWRIYRWWSARRAARAAAKARAAEAAMINIGARVKLRGLKKKPELNGCEGECIRQTETGRWEVQLDSGELLSFNTDNIKLVGDDE